MRLETAAKIAFPDGTMGAKGLRKERDRGRLATEIIAGKEYTTLAAIGEMRRLCCVQAKERPGRANDQFGRKPDGSSSTDAVEIAQAACEAQLERLKNTFKNAPKNTPRRRP
ncbi:excisionase [Mesorhizobium sp. B1-1-5]|uniref:excisionase n=1 Tax=Mesorhizobium sp. B1-1-5 TaxID=2589979 RepID=UPI001FEDABB1|nr:excisionase [Mesorhizobium sp. B1-1-5]